MKFHCKKCQKEFDENYDDLFETITCPSCKKQAIVLNFIKQGILPPQEGFGLSFWEFEDVLETGKENYLKDFFKEEFNLQFLRKGYEYALLDGDINRVNPKEIFEETQKDGKLQRMFYNIHYVLLQGN